MIIVGLKTNLRVFSLVIYSAYTGHVKHTQDCHLRFSERFFTLGPLRTLCSVSHTSDLGSGLALSIF